MATQMTQELTLDLRVERFPYHQPFRISGHVFTETALLVAELSDGTHVGRGEGAGVYYLGDDIDHMLAEATRVRDAIERGATRAGTATLAATRRRAQCARLRLLGSGGKADGAAGVGARGIETAARAALDADARRR